MTTYVQVEAARRAYNELAAGCGRGEIPLGAIMELCGASSHDFKNNGAEPPPLSPDREAVAAAVLRRLEDEIAALNDGRVSSVGDLIAEAGELKEGGSHGARRLIKEGAQLGLDPIAKGILLDAIQARTKMKRPGLAAYLKQAEGQANAERRAKGEAEDAAVRDRPNGSLQEVLAERVAPLAATPTCSAAWSPRCTSSASCAKISRLRQST